MGGCCGKRKTRETEHLLEEVRSPGRFSAVAYSVMCTLCDKPVQSLFDTRKDARGKPYHAQCCRCAKCGRSLNGETVTLRFDRAFCRLHAAPERGADVASTPAGASLADSVRDDTAHVDVSELCDAMVDRLVMMPPTCASCGGIFAPRDEIRFVGMMKLHTDCLIGRPGPGRSAAVPKKTPLQMAKGALEFLAIRVTITPDNSNSNSNSNNNAGGGSGGLNSSTTSLLSTPSSSSLGGGPAALYTFFLARSPASFAEIERMRNSTQGSAAVTVAYDAVVNKHLSTVKRDVPDGVLDVIDVAGNFTSARDRVRTSGDNVTATLTRVDCGNRMDLRVSITWARATRTLTLRGGCIFYEAHIEC